MGTCRIEQDQNPSKKPGQNLNKTREGNTCKEKRSSVTLVVELLRQMVTSNSILNQLMMALDTHVINVRKSSLQWVIWGDTLK